MKELDFLRPDGSLDIKEKGVIRYLPTGGGGIIDGGTIV